jgi:3-oxoacyl-[acyl-carrier protein] reductase
LILGGRGDIGSAIVKKFQEAGDDVLLPSSQDLDLTQTESIDQFLTDLNIDVLIHSAGWNEPQSIENITAAHLKKSLDINLLGFFHVIQTLLPSFKQKKEGHILGISSLYSSFARMQRAPYCMTKHALNGLIKVLALELGAYNIKVNTLSPGFVDTKMTRKNNNPETIQSFEKKISLGRLASTTDIATVAFFLCSQENQYLHGQNIIVDGGYSIGGFQNS